MIRRVLAVLVVPLLVASGAAADQWDEVARRLTPNRSPVALSLTTLLCRYLGEQGRLKPADLDGVATPEAFRALIQARTGKDLVDIGYDMVESSVRKAESDTKSPISWSCSRCSMPRRSPAF